MKLRLLKRRKKRTVRPPKTHTSTARANPYFPKDHRSWWQREGWVMVSILVIVSVGVIYMIFFSPFLSVKDIRVSGLEHISEDELFEIINEYRGGRTAYVFPHNAYMMFNTEDLEAYIRKRVANRFALKDVSITKNLKKGVTVEIEERIPGVAFQTGENLYYLDEYGVVSNEVIEGERDPEFSLILDKNSQTISIDQQVVSEEWLNSVLDAVKIIPRSIGLPLDHIEIPPIVCKDLITEAGLFESEPLPETQELEREIQEQVAMGELTIEESLQALSEIDETSSTPEPEKTFTVRQTSKEAPCDYSKVLDDFVLVFDNGTQMYLTIGLELTERLHTMDVALAEAGRVLEDLQYVDLRFTDRVNLK